MRKGAPTARNEGGGSASGECTTRRSSKGYDPDVDPTGPQPDFGVVVTIVSGADSVRECLLALRHASAGRDVDIVVPVERERPDVAVLAAEFDEVRFLDIGPIDAEVSGDDPCAEHVRYDIRRAAGLRRVRGRLIVMLEDHGIPSTDFFAAAENAWRRSDAGAIGGVVACDADDGIRAAAWILDFSRHLPNARPGSSDVLTDVNVTFRKENIDAVAPTWRTGYHEPRVHAALARRGGLLRDPAMRIAQRRPPLSAGAYLGERWRWGRHFGRGRNVGGTSVRIAAALIAMVGSPAFGVRALFRAGFASRILRAAPWVIVGAVAWGIGEAAGLLDARPERARQSFTDA